MVGTMIKRHRYCSSLFSIRHLLGRLLVVGMLVCISAPVATAQPFAPTSDTSEPLSLSLSDALSRAQSESFAVRSARAQEQAARAQKRQSLAVFLPRLTAAEQFGTTTDPVNAFGFKLKQERFTQQDFQVGALNNPQRTDNFATTLEVEQPLLNIDGFFARRAAAAGARAARQRTERTQAVVAFRVKKSYYRVVLTERQLAVIDAALRAARANVKQAQALFDEGMINRADLLAARVRVLALENQRSSVRARRRNVADRLRLLLGIRDDVQIAPTDSLVQEGVAIPPIDIHAVNQRRSDMDALRYRADAAREQVRARWLAFVPKLNARGTYGWYDDTPLGTHGASYTIGASLSWSLFEGYRQVGRAQQAGAELQHAEISLQQQALRNEVDILAARRTIETARERIAQARQAVEQAKESLRIRTDRYAEGMARTTDVLQAEATLAERRLALLRALYQHNVAVYRLELLIEQPLTNN
ncbi:TolC family protein [Salisaeta longa]|uniref:TolC family protein n=1 Tax=Salisaeta longa TaxID=503170 RepID=UPI0003B3DDF7|nr:TolC family protein [Salisaeta longa]